MAGQSRAPAVENGEDQPDGLLDLLVEIEDHPAACVEEQACRRAEAEFSVLCHQGHVAKSSDVDTRRQEAAPVTQRSWSPEGGETHTPARAQRLLYSLLRGGWSPANLRR